MGSARFGKVLMASGNPAHESVTGESRDHRDKTTRASCGITLPRQPVIAFRSSRNSRCDTTALLTSSSRRTPISFVLQLLLGRLSARRVQHIVHGNRDLLRHLLHEVDLCLLIGSPLIAPKSHRPETTLRRCERNHTEGLDAVLAQHGHQLRKALLLRHIVHGQRLLGFPHQSPGRFIDGVAPDRG